MIVVWLRYARGVINPFAPALPQNLFAVLTTTTVIPKRLPRPKAENCGNCSPPLSYDLCGHPTSEVAMFCNKCGAVVDAGSNSCARCGTAVVGGSQTPAYSSPAIGYVGSKLARRLAVLVVLWIIYGVLEAARAAAFQFAAHLSRFWVTGPDWSRWGAPGILHWVVMWSACGALLAFFAAWGLHERRSWDELLQSCRLCSLLLIHHSARYLARIRWWCCCPPMQQQITSAWSGYRTASIQYLPCLNLPLKN